MSILRRGFTLVEILVAMVAFSLVATVIMRTLIMSQRVTTAQTARAQMHSNLRVASFVVPNELRMLNQASSTDILDVSNTSITYLAMRGYYVLCNPIASATTIRVARVTSGSGLEELSFDYRSPVAGDSGFIFFENDTLKMSDDTWIPVGISAVAAATCTYPSAVAGLNLTLTGAGLPNASYLWTNFISGAPLRSYEITRLAEYTSGGEQWLGMCTGSTTCTLQPVAGPLTSSNGFLLTRYNDAGAVVTGNTTANRNSLRSLKVRFAMKTEQAISRGTDRGAMQVVADTLTTIVTLRNVKQN